MKKKYLPEKQINILGIKLKIEFIILYESTYTSVLMRKLGVQVIVVDRELQFLLQFNTLNVDYIGASSVSR